MFRELPPKIKIYEALGCVADDRIQITGLLNNEAKCYSSSLGKFYIIKYNADQNSIITNDNGSYWKGYLGYPAIAFLMKIGKISYDEIFSDALKGIKRKDINQNFKNNFDKTADHIHSIILSKGLDLNLFIQDIDNIYSQIEKFNLKILLPKIKPPQGY